jgi:hypothetical protein
VPLDRIRRLPGVARANTGAGEQAKSSTGGSAVAVPRCQQRAHGRAQQCADDSATGHLSVGGIHRVGATDLLFGILLAGGLILLEHVEGFVGRRHYRNARAQWLGHASAKQKDDRKPQILCFDEIHMGSLFIATSKERAASEYYTGAHRGNGPAGLHNNIQTQTFPDLLLAPNLSRFAKPLPEAAKVQTGTAP